MSNVQVQIGGNTVQVQVQSSGFARANAAVTAAAASATAAAASAASAAATLAAAALKANNLSDLASASTARTNLGVAIGTNVQAYSANLDEYAAVNPTAAGLALLDDADASAQRTTLGLGSIATQAASAVAITGGSIAGITDLAVADGGTGASSASAARDNLGLTIGTNVQAYDADLGAIAALTSAANKAPYATGAGTWALADQTAFARTLMDDADAGTARTTLAAVGTAELAASTGAALVGSITTGTGATARTVQAKQRDIISVMDFGAVGDGTLHTVAEWIIPGALGRYANLAALQVDYPHVTATTDSLDWAAIQSAINAWRVRNRDGVGFVDYPADLLFPSGHTFLITSILDCDPLYNTVGGRIVGYGAQLKGSGLSVGLRINTGANSVLWRGLVIEGLKFSDCGLKMQSVNGAGVNIYGFRLLNLEFTGKLAAAPNLWFEGCFEGLVSGCEFNRDSGADSYDCIFVDNSGFGFQSSVVWIGNTTRGGRNGFRQTGYAGDCFRYGNTHLTARAEGAYIECSNVVDFGGHYEENCVASGDAGLSIVGAGIIDGITAACATNLQKYGVRIYASGGSGIRIGTGVDYATISGHKLAFIDGAATTPIFIQAGTYDVSGAVANSAYLTAIGASGGLQVGANKVVGVQGAAVADATGGAVVDAEARTALNDLLARCRAHGLIAT
jgi:hypothetical protein